MGEARNTELDDLLAHAGWLRRLARQLVKRPDDVDDLTQETWAAALRQPPDKGRSPRPWLAEVMRNLLRMRVRGERRRQARESESDLTARLARSTSVDLMERMERQRLVAELVMALDEPYRATVLLRFYEERSTREIARLQGVAEATVRWRVKVAMDRLRQELRRKHGAATASWLASLVPPVRAFPSELVQGVIFMAARSKGKLAIFGLLAISVTLLGVGTWLRRDKVSPIAGSAAYNTGLPGVGSSSPPSRRTAPGDLAQSLAALSVQVVDPDGAPAAGVAVALSRAPGTDLPTLAGTARTDSAGRCGFAGIAAGTYALTASTSRRFAPAIESGIRLKEGMKRTVHLVLARGGHLLEGKVMDRGAGAIAGADVTAIGAAPPEEPGGPIRHFLARTDDQGAYRMTLTGGFYSVAARADGYPRASQFVSLDADRTVNFRLDPGTPLSGRVVHRQSGAGVAGARVQAVPTDRLGYRRPGVESDADGYFTLPSVAPGEWRIQARKGALVGSTGALRVMPTLAIDGISVPVDQAFSISGRVLAADGRGMGDAVVVAELRDSTLGSGARTDPGGAFVIEGLPPGYYDLGAQTNDDRPRGYGEARIHDRHLSGVELRMPAPVIVEGRVIDSAGHPVGGARVYALMGQTAGARDVSRGTLASTDPTGHFTFKGLDPGGLTIRAERGEIGVATWGPEPVSPGDVKTVTLRLTAGATLRGTVLYSDGGAAVGATVSVRSPEKRGRITQGTVGPDGRYVVRAIHPGLADIAAHRSRAARLDQGSVQVPLSEGQESSLDFRLARAATIQGIVLVSDGAPAIAAAMVASKTDSKPPPTHPSSATTNLDGAFVIEDLDLGSTYHVWADMPGRSANATAIAGASHGLILKLPDR